MPGPPRKKEAERRRRNKDGVETEVINLDEVLAGERIVPVADEEWHPVAYDLFESMKKSGQAIFMEPSDWAVAYTLCETLSRWMLPQEVKVGERDTAELLDIVDGAPVVLQGKEYLYEDKILPMPGGVLTAILKGLAALMATEGDRRKLRLELERQKAIDAATGGGVVIDIATSRDEAFRLAGIQQGS